MCFVDSVCGFFAFACFYVYFLLFYFLLGLDNMGFYYLIQIKIDWLIDWFIHDTRLWNRRHKSTPCVWNEIFLAPKINMAESVDDEFVTCNEIVTRKHIKKYATLPSTNHKSSFQSRARHFLAWNRTVFISAPESGTRRIRCQTYMTHVPEIGAGKMGLIYGAGFWNVCHGC